MVTRATPEQLINEAAEALGGLDRVRSVRTLVLHGEGTQHNLGQDVLPGASGQTFTVTEFARSVDVANGRARTELTREPRFAFFQGPAAQRQVTGIDGDVAYNIGANGAATRAPGSAVSDRQLEILHHPLTALRAALGDGVELSNARTQGGDTLVDITTREQTITLAVDSTTKLPTSVSHRADNVNLGDVVMTTAFADYREVGGLRLPTQLSMTIDDFILAEYRLSSQTVDADTGDLLAPQGARDAAIPAGPSQVTTEVIAPGIWFLGGGSHHSVLVEFADHLTLIEAPQHDQRALAVIEKARATVPGKPLTQLVNSHHHFDHSGGVRAAISEGLTLITHEANRAFYEEMAARPHTLSPDALAKSPSPLIIETVEDERVLTDGSMTVQLHAVTGAHCESMLTAYFPREQVLVEGDVYSPAGTTHMFAGKFLDDVRARALSVETIIPLHGAPVPFAQLVSDAAAQASSR